MQISKNLTINKNISRYKLRAFRIFNNMDTTINERIAQIVTQLGNGKNTVIASFIGVSEGNIRGYVKGVMPKQDVLEKIVTKLDINPEWLLTGRGEMLKSQSGMGESASNVIQGNHNSNNVQHIAEGDRREVDHLKEIIRMKDALLKCKESENELLREIIKKKEGHE